MTDNEMAVKSFSDSELVYKVCRDEQSYVDGYLAGCEDKRTELQAKFTKAKGIIRDLLSCLYSVEYDMVSNLEEAEQFLKEELE